LGKTRILLDIMVTPSVGSEIVENKYFSAAFLGSFLEPFFRPFSPVFRPFFAGRLRFARDVVYEMPSSIPNSGGSDRVVTNGRYLPLEVFYTGEEKGFGVWCTERIQEVRKRSSFPPHFKHCQVYARSVCQDRLGTNMGKT